MWNDQNKRQLNLIGITYNQIESGVYAVILQEEGGDRRIPIIIGFPEAQAIECRLQEITPPRPLTHDMMAETLNQFGIRLLEADIYKLPSGVFAAQLILDDGVCRRSVDSRSSDAIALAIRMDAPIFTTEEVLQEVGFTSDTKSGKRQGRPSAPRRAAQPVKASQPEDLRAMSLEQLRQRMQEAAENENYELAARIKTEIDRRNEPDSADADIVY